MEFRRDIARVKSEWFDFFNVVRRINIQQGLAFFKCAQTDILHRFGDSDTGQLFAAPKCAVVNFYQ